MKKPHTGFETERYRQQLLKLGKFELLKSTYSKKYPEIPAQNSPHNWDQILTQPARYHPMAHHRRRLILAQMKPHTKVLNLGVGRGELEAMVWEKYQDQIKWTGTDFTHQTLEKFQEKYPIWKFQKVALHQLPFKDRSFDQVLFLEVLEHIQPKATLQVLIEIWRVLTVGGKLIVSVPINEGLEEKFPLNHNHHARLYTLQLLKWELLQAGFEITSVQQLTAFRRWYALKSWLNQLLHLRSANNLILTCLKK